MNENYNNQHESYNGRTKKCPPLTQGERELLNNHCGCTKCRKFYVEHRSYECDDWPDPQSYRMLTLQDALNAKPRQNRRTNRGNGNANVVAATMPRDTEFDDIYNVGMMAMRGNNKAEQSMSAPPTSHI